MYTINTQLAYFKYNFDSKKMIVNIRWFKRDKLEDLFFACKSFSKREAEQFKGFIDQNPANFTGSYFVVETQREYFDRLEVMNGLKMLYRYISFYLKMQMYIPALIFMKR